MKRNAQGSDSALAIELRSLARDCENVAQRAERLNKRMRTAIIDKHLALITKLLKQAAQTAETAGYYAALNNGKIRKQSNEGV